MGKTQNFELFIKVINAKQKYWMAKLNMQYVEITRHVGNIKKFIVSKNLRLVLGVIKG